MPVVGLVVAAAVILWRLAAATLSLMRCSARAFDSW
jgi:hypothetical protein